jgi:hypothetical protein
VKREKVSRFKALAAVLLRLRRDEISMEEVRPQVRGILTGRALYFLNRWKERQTLYTFEDLYSMGEAAVWRAVDTWDPAKHPHIEAHVDCEVGRAMEKPLKAAAGYPDPRRSDPALQVYFTDMSKPGRGNGRYRGEYSDREATTTMDKLLRLDRGAASDVELHNIDLERRQLALAACERVTDDFGRLVLQLVLKGYTISGAGEAMYASRRLRMYYGLRNREHARKAAHAAAVRVRREVAQSAA